jgi:hypothetical protein
MRSIGSYVSLVVGVAPDVNSDGTRQIPSTVVSSDPAGASIVVAGDFT